MQVLILFLLSWHAVIFYARFAVLPIHLQFSCAISYFTFNNFIHLLNSSFEYSLKICIVNSVHLFHFPWRMTIIKLNKAKNLNKPSFLFQYSTNLVVIFGKKLFTPELRIHVLDLNVTWYQWYNCFISFFFIPKMNLCAPYYVVRINAVEIIQLSEIPYI